MAPGRGAVGAPPPGPRDTTLRAARELLGRGLSVPAAGLLSRGLSRGELSGPGPLLLAARAYSSHGDWGSVRRLLLGQAWLDSESEGAGRRLLARARLENGDPAAAADDYERYFSTGPEAAPLEARVNRARALEASGRPGEAAAVLNAAALEAPEIGHWLRLSALQARMGALRSTPDSSLDAADREASELLELDALPADTVFALRTRLAFARGDTAAALEFAERAGAAAAELTGTRVAPALLVRGDTAGAVEAYTFALRSPRPPAELAPALLALDSGWNAYLLAARSDLGAGRLGRAVAGLREALERAPPGERPGVARRLSRALRAAGDPRGALVVLRPWLDLEGVDAAVRADLWLAAADAMADAGRPGDAAEALRAAATGSGGSAAFAAYLLADRFHDEGAHEAAREAYAAAYERVPDTRFGERALVRLGLLDVLEGLHGAAEARFEEYRRRYSDGVWATGALYWMGRTALARGDSSLARGRFEAVLARDPTGYYGILAGERLGRDPWRSMDGAGSGPGPARIGAAARVTLERMDRLRSIGWADRARAEYRLSGLSALRDARELLGLALALDSAGWTTEGVGAAWRARSRGLDWSPALLRGVYPLPYRHALRHAARERGLSPALVAGLVRRESLFDPAVVSSAGAVGLMQLLPSTALDVAASAGLPDFRLSQLTNPEVNLLLGTRYLADLLDRFGDSRTAALIAYNAGPHRYGAWRAFPERTADPELFVERIPFRETREYVRAVHALVRTYSRIHRLADPGRSASGVP